MKNKLQKKSVVFAGKTYTLFSLDGNTWSTNPDELALIIERHKNQRDNVKDSLTGANNQRAAVESEKSEEAKPSKQIVGKQEGKSRVSPKVVLEEPKAKPKKVKEAANKKLANKRASQAPKKKVDTVSSKKKANKK